MTDERKNESKPESKEPLAWADLCQDDPNFGRTCPFCDGAVPAGDRYRHGRGLCVEGFDELEVPDGASLGALAERVDRLERAPVHFEFDGVRGEDGTLEIRGVSLCPGADPDRPVFVVVARDRLEEMSAKNVLDMMRLAGQEESMDEIADEIARRHAFVVREYHATNQQLRGQVDRMKTVLADAEREVATLRAERDDMLDRATGFQTESTSPGLERLDARTLNLGERVADASSRVVALIRDGADLRTLVETLSAVEPIAISAPRTRGELVRLLASVREAAVEAQATPTGHRFASLLETLGEFASALALAPSVADELRPRWDRVEELVAWAREKLDGVATPDPIEDLDETRSILRVAASILASPSADEEIHFGDERDEPQCPLCERRGCPGTCHSAPSAVDGSEEPPTE